MPTTLPEVLSFLGFTGFYRQFIEGYSTIALPLTRSVKSKIIERPSKNDPSKLKRKVHYEAFHPTDEHRAAFAKLKAAFKPDIVLRHFDPKEPLHIFTDASGWASGGVLKQRNSKGVLQPIAFFSKKHTPAECNYDIYDLELLAIIRAFEEWEPELMGSGHPIQVVTDHKNLETFMKTKKLNRRQARWSLFLSQFDFTIQYSPGKTNGEADALSRRSQDIPKDDTDARLADCHSIILQKRNLAPGMAPILETSLRSLSIAAPDRPDYISSDVRAIVKLCTSSTGDSDDDTDLKEAEIDNLNGTLPTALPPYSDDPRTTEELLNHAYATDPAAAKVFQALDAGERKLPPWFKKNAYYFSLSDCQTTGTGDERRLFINGTRLYTPPPDARLRRRIFDMCHDHEIAGHKGTRGTFYLMFPRYYWPKMAQSIKKYCQACAVCKRASSPRDGYNGFLRPLHVPEGPWLDISLDYIQDLPPSTVHGQTYRNLLVVVDRFTKRRHFFPSVGRTSKEFAEHFMHIFRLHGLPRTIVSDRGTSFVNRFWRRVCQRLGIKLKISTAHHPETDGQSEIANQALETYLRKYVNYTQNDWAARLHVAEFQANDTVNSSTGLTPFFADLGYHPRSGIHPTEDFAPPPLLTREAKDQILRADEMLDAHADLVEYLKIQLTWAQQEMQAQANAHRQQTPKYAIGDRVWVSTRNWRTDRPSKKLDAKYAGPYPITRIIHNGAAYEIELPANMIANGVFPVFHPNLIRGASQGKLPDQAAAVPEPLYIANADVVVSEEWLVDEFLDCRKKQGIWCYQVKWTNDAHPTWEPVSGLFDHYDALLYHYNNPGKPKPPGFHMPAGWLPRAEDQI